MPHPICKEKKKEIAYFFPAMCKIFGFKHSKSDKNYYSFDIMSEASVYCVADISAEVSMWALACPVS